MPGPIPPENQGIVGAAAFAYGVAAVSLGYYLAQQKKPVKETGEASDDTALQTVDSETRPEKEDAS